MSSFRSRLSLTARVPRAPVPLLLAALLLCAALGCAHAPPPGEKPQIVDTIEIRGLATLDPKELLDKLGTEKQPWYPFAQKRYLSGYIFRKDLERILQFCREHGFFRARITDTQVVEIKQGKYVKIVITVDEGPPAIVTRLALDGLEPLPPKARARVLRKFPLKEGERFDYGHFQSGGTQLKARLRSLGYATVKVEANARGDQTKSEMIVEYKVTLNPLASFGETHLRGLARVPEKLVRERLYYQPGDRFNPDALATTRGRIFELSVFSVVNIKERPRPEHPEIVDIDIELRESKFRSIKVGGGLGIDQARQEIHLQAIWRHNNFLGGLRRLELGLKPGYAALPDVFTRTTQGPILKTYAELLQPSVILPLLNWKTRLEYELGIQQGYQFHGPRLRTGLERLFGKVLTVSVTYNFEFYDFYNIDPALFDPTKTPLGLGFKSHYVLGYIEERLMLDLRDNPNKTRNGGYFAVNLEQSAPALASNFAYFKVQPEARGYYSPWKRVVFAGRFLVGTMIPIGGADTPVSQRFYGGGAADNRGFGYRRLSPLVVAADKSTLPIGGLSKVSYTAEVRVRTWQQLYFVVFHDAGDVSPNQNDLRFGNLDYQLGGGLRYLTPIGPIRFDIGVRLGDIHAPAADPGNRLGFQFSIGEAF